MNARTVSLLFGFIFVTVGLVGFIPNPLVAADGLFAVNAIHNLVHILTGAVFLVGAVKFPGKESRILIAVGVAYVAVTALGFLSSGNMLLGLVHINEADRWLHLGLAIAILGSGFAFAADAPRTLFARR